MTDTKTNILDVDEDSTQRAGQGYFQSVGILKTQGLRSIPSRQKKDMHYPYNLDAFIDTMIKQFINRF